MCNPASFVLTRNAAFWSWHTDSHEEIIAEAGLIPDGVRGSNIVRVEVLPPDYKFDASPDKWKYVIDQPTTPEWYDANDCERRARLALKEWIAARVIGSGDVNLSRPGRFYVCGAAVVHAHDNNTVVALDSSTVAACGRAKVIARDSSTVYAAGNCTVWAFGQAVVRVACDNAYVAICDSVKVLSCRDNVTVDQCGGEVAPPTGYAVVIDRRNGKPVTIVAE